MARPRKNRPAVDLTDNLTAIGYGRVSTDEQAQSGLGLDAQNAVIHGEVARRPGWNLAHVYVDAGASGKSLAQRPELGAALAELEAGRAQVLVVAKLDRLTRSLDDFLALAQLAGRQGWALVVCDIAGMDMTSPIGKALVRMLATFAELERQMIGQRTRDALFAARARGTRLGRPSAVPTDVVRRINSGRDAGMSWREIGQSLEADGVRTTRGGARWYPATVRAVWISQKAAALRDTHDAAVAQ